MTPIKLIMKNIGPFNGKVEVDFSIYKGIFLIAGDTGAGKTTILDAICYAFFGRTPSFVKGPNKKSFASDFISESDHDSFVDFTFRINENGTAHSYEIYRSVPNEKNNTDVCKLFSLDDEKKCHEFAGKKTEVQNKILDIIKLSYEEFSKIILLPQGAFSDFIKQNSKEKEEILKDIFDVKKFSSFIKKLSDEAALKKTEVINLENQIQKMQETYNDNNYESIQREARETINTLKREAAEVSKQLEIKSAEKFQAERFDAKKKELAEEKERFEKIQADENEMSVLKEKVDKAQKVLPLIVHVKNIAELEEKRTAAEKKLDEVTEAAKTSETQLSELTNENTLAYIEAQKLLREKLIQQEDRLQQAARLYENFSVDKGKLFETERMIKPKKKEYEQKSEELAALKNELEPLSEKIEKLNAYSDEVETKKTRYDKIQQSVQVLKEYNEKKLTRNATEINVTKYKTKLSLLEKNILIETEELEQLKRQKEKTEQAALAVKLAATLRDDEPCPVCGSRHHPKPATSELMSTFSFDERIEKSENALKNFNTERDEIREKAISFREKLSAISESLSDLENKLSESGFDAAALETDAMNTKLETARTELNDATKKLSAAKQAIEKKAMIEQRIKTLERTGEQILSELTELEKKQTELQAAIKANQTQLEKILPDGFDITANSPEVALEKTITEKETVTRTINAHHENVQEVTTKLEKQKTQIEETEKQLSAMSEQLEKNNAELESECERVSIEKENVLNFFLDENTIDEYRQTISRFNENKIAVTEKIKSLQTELDSAPELDLGKILGEIAAYSSKADEIQERLILTTEELTATTETHNRYTELCKNHEAAVSEANAIKKLYDKVSGNNTKKLKFDTWRLSHLFRQVITFANKRFTAISNDRYFLELSSEAQSKQGYSGLDLLVYDSHTGKTRFVSTLSGGETFIASVCIALGLADTLTNNAGGIHIDSMFIDEGFGSLDSENLARVFDSLELVTQYESLQLLGIISHITELENRIPQKLHVIKTNQGSRIEQ